MTGAARLTGDAAGASPRSCDKTNSVSPLDSLGDGVVPCSHKVSWGAVADNSAEDIDLLQGTLDVLILKTLSWGPRHGYAIARWVHDVSDDVLRVEEGALYPALHRLEKRGWIEAEWGLSENNRKAKYYQLTTLGRQQLRAKATTWARYSAAVSKVLAVG